MKLAISPRSSTQSGTRGLPCNLIGSTTTVLKLVCHTALPALTPPCRHAPGLPAYLRRACLLPPTQFAWLLHYLSCLPAPHRCTGYLVHLHLLVLLYHLPIRCRYACTLRTTATRTACAAAAHALRICTADMPPATRAVTGVLRPACMHALFHSRCSLLRYYTTDAELAYLLPACLLPATPLPLACGTARASFVCRSLRVTRSFTDDLARVPSCEPPARLPPMDAPFAAWLLQHAA